MKYNAELAKQELLPQLKKLKEVDKIPLEPVIDILTQNLAIMLSTPINTQLYRFLSSALLPAIATYEHSQAKKFASVCEKTKEHAKFEPNINSAFFEQLISAMQNIWNLLHNPAVHFKNMEKLPSELQVDLVKYLGQIRAQVEENRRQTLGALLHTTAMSDVQSGDIEKNVGSKQSYDVVQKIKNGLL